MQGPIAQVIALTAYGNAFLQGSSGPNQTAFYPSNSTFTFCEYVKFANLRLVREKWEETPYASDPGDWFERLRNDAVIALRMIYGPSGEKKMPDRMMVGFVGGGGRWLIEAIGLRSSDYWEGRWQVGDRDRTDRRIWHVAYGRIAGGQVSSKGTLDNLGDLKEEMGRNLSEIADFARTQNLDHFAKAFESGLSRLASPQPYNNLYHKDIAPLQLLPLAAHQLLGAAQDAWVFGGMGSWNDVGVEKKSQARYEELSERLYQLLNRAIVAATNSSMLGVAQRAEFGTN